MFIALFLLLCIMGLCLGAGMLFEKREFGGGGILLIIAALVMGPLFFAATFLLSKGYPLHENWLSEHAIYERLGEPIQEHEQAQWSNKTYLVPLKDQAGEIMFWRVKSSPPPSFFKVKTGDHSKVFEPFPSN